VIFHEKLNLKFDVEAMREQVATIQQTLGDRVGQGSEGVKGMFGGWALQSQDGDWRSGFEKGGYFESEGSLVAWETVPPVSDYNKRTDACVGIFADIVDELEDKGFYPLRSRITVFDPGQATMWHTDALPDIYSIRIHIPFMTNADCRFEVEDVGAVHMPADGHGHLVDVSTMHRAFNRGDTTRMHFLAQVWPTDYSEKFIVTESRKDISGFYNVKGRKIFDQVMRDKAKG